MKRWLYQTSIGSLFILSIVFITVLLYLTQGGGSFWNTGTDHSSFELPLPLILSMHNLYLIPLLLAAVFLGETWCVVLALFATAGSGLVEQRLQLPPDMMAAWSVAIRGAFFVSLGYLASQISRRLRASTQSWQSLLEITRSINATLDLEQTLQSVTLKSVELTSADACAIRLLDDASGELIYGQSSGLGERYLNKGPLHVKDDPILEQIMRDRALVIRDIRKTTSAIYRDESIEEGIIMVMHVPLLNEGKVIGLLNLYRKHLTHFTSRDCRVARAFAEQVAIAVHNARLYALVRKNYLDTVRAFTRALEARDALALGHSERVAELSVKMAHALQLPASDIQTIEFGALLHDLGKISLEDEILATTGELSLDARVLLEMHPMIGKSIIEPIEFLQPSIPIVLYHHERWDGQGYPERLAGDAVPLLARIVSVANHYDAIMYHSSPFPLLQEEALNEMQQLAGTYHDPELIALLTQVLSKPVATSVQQQVIPTTT